MKIAIFMRDGDVQRHEYLWGWEKAIASQPEGPRARMAFKNTLSDTG